jgi:hypothetical protein
MAARSCLLMPMSMLEPTALLRLDDFFMRISSGTEA